MRTIEINDQFKKALDLIDNSRKNLLIFGKAGTGKSTFLNYCRSHTKKVVVLAPTGIAIINVNGQPSILLLISSILLVLVIKHLDGFV